MSENEEPDWLAELTRNAEALRRQIEESSEALHRQVDQLVRGAEQFAHDAQLATPGGPVPPFQQRVVRAAGSVVRGLVPAAGYPVRYGSFKGYAISSVGTISGSGSVAMPPMRVVADGDVVTATEAASGEVVPGRPHGLAALSDGEIVFLVLVWLYAVWLPWVGSRLPPELHGMLTDSYATFGIALAITTWRLADKHK